MVLFSLCEPHVLLTEWNVRVFPVEGNTGVGRRGICGQKVVLKWVAIRKVPAFDLSLKCLFFFTCHHACHFIGESFPSLDNL